VSTLGPGEMKPWLAGKSPCFNRKYIFKWWSFQPAMFIVGGASEKNDTRVQWGAASSLQYATETV